MIVQPVMEWCLEHFYGKVISSRPVGGGCINNGAVLETSSGRTLFIKTNSQAPPEMFVREAEGLEALRAGAGPRAPEPYLWGVDFLLLEDLQPARRRPDYWSAFGRALAALHERTSPRFGSPHANYIGRTVQPNPWTEDGHAFFGEQRLLFQARLAQERGLLGRDNLRRVEALTGRLPELVPAQPASLLHGDLWSGNVLSDLNGEPAIIDPAAHSGWAEADLAMTALFGGFPAVFYDAYIEARPLSPGWRERFPIYNLYHLLNHLNLFGMGYLGEVQEVLRRFG